MTSDSSDSSIAPIEHLTIVAAPVLFVILWSSGFVGAKLGLPYTERLLVFANVWRGDFAGCDRIMRTPQMARPHGTFGQLRNRRLHARTVFRRRIHFHRKR